jgi:hypothetical protein
VTISAPACSLEGAGIALFIGDYGTPRKGGASSEVPIWGTYFLRGGTLVGNLQQLAVSLAHIAASPHEGLLGTPAQRPGAQDAWLNIIASRYRRPYGPKVTKVIPERGQEVYS